MGDKLRAGVYGRQSRNKAKSIAEQVDAGTAVARDEGWTVAGTYQDGTSASRYARKSREAWTRVLGDIDAGNLDLLILWEASRGDRTLTSWSGLLDLCRERGVCIYVIADERVYDPRRARDWKVLASPGVDSAGESDLLSVRVRRGQAGSAAAGRPAHGRCPYGYRRTFDAGTGALAGQEPDPQTSPTVRRIYADISRGVPVARVVEALTTEGVPPIAGAKGWYRQRIRDIIQNPAYRAARAYNGVEHPATWPPLVDDVLWYRANRVLSDPARVTTRPGRQKHLLSYLGLCDECDAGLTAVRGRYRCSERGCVTIVQADADRFVEAMVLAKFALPDVYTALRQKGSDDDRLVMEAQARAEQLRGELDGWRRSAAAGQTTPESLAVVEAGLVARIREAEQSAKRLAVPATVQQFLEPGVDVRSRWDAAPRPVQRDLVRELAEIRIGPATVPGRRSFEPGRFVSSRWRGDTQTWGDLWESLGIDVSTLDVSRID